jgi:hypothetical protein
MYISSTFIKLANLYISALFFNTHLRFRGVSNSRGYRVIRRLAYAMGHLVACAALLATDARALHAGPPRSTPTENSFWRRDGHVSRLQDPLPAVKSKIYPV